LLAVGRLSRSGPRCSVGLYAPVARSADGVDEDDTIRLMSGAHSPLLRQGSLFAEEPVFDPALCGLARTDLGGGAWIDHLPEWVRGHESVLDVLWTTTRWEAHRRRMRNRFGECPRLGASLPEDGPGHPLIPGLAAALAARYGR